MTDPPRPEPTTSWTAEAGPVEPRMELAESLEAADARTFVYVDDSGRVRPAWRYRALQLASWGVLTLLTLAGSAILVAVGGWLGLAVSALLVMMVLHLALLSSWIHRGVVLLAHDRLAAADGLLALAQRFSLFHLGIRALALQNRSGVAQRQGEHQRALELCERSLKLREAWPAAFGRGLHYWLLRYGEVMLLCNVDRVAEARARLSAISNPPPGEYIRLRSWTAELYVMLCEGKLELELAELERRSVRASALRTSPELLALCAWGWHTRGELERAERQLETAEREADASPFAESLPALARWMNAVRRHDDRTTLPHPPSRAR